MAAQTTTGYKIATATNLEEIEKIRNIWESMQTHPNSDIDHYINVINLKQNIIRPHIILLNYHDRPISMIAGRIEKLPFDLKFGYKRLFSPMVQSLTIIYGGLLGDLTKSSCEILFKEFTRLLSSGQVDIIRINYLDINSPLYHFAAKTPRMFSRDLFPIFNTHWRMILPETIEAFYKSRSRKHRYWLRRIERLLEQDYPDEVKYIGYESDGGLAKLFTDAEYIARKTYQRGLHVGFIDSGETRKIYSLLAKQGRLRAYVMYIKNEPSAFWIGEHYRNTFYLYSTGYDPIFKKYEIGTILFVKMLKNLFSIGGIEYLDFGFGDAPYKMRFGDESWQEATVHVFSTNFSGIKLNMLRMLTMGSYRFSLGLLKGLNLLGKAKKLRRSQVTPKGEEKSGAAEKTTV
jgi:hypothetical protein